MITLLFFLEVVGLAILPYVLLSSKRPVSKLIWISVILFLPGIGPACYFLIGNDRLRRRRIKRKASRQKHDQTEAHPLRSFREVDQGEQEILSTLGRLCRKQVSSISSANHYYSGKDYYPALLTAIRESTHFIHAEVYLWHNDKTGQRILAELVNAAQRGVEVLLLVDEIGSIEVSENFFSPLVDAGGKFSWFYTIHPRRNRYFFNLRNHRKLQVIDGRVAFIGGMNIGLEYEGLNISTGEWKDMHLRLEGEVVGHLDEVFHRDWYFATDEKLPRQEQPVPQKEQHSRYPTVIIESGPDSNYGNALTSLLAIINYAKEQLDLFTPYFVPVSSLITALQIAVARGVKVRLMISKKNDIQFLVDIGRSFYDELLAAGVEIYEYDRCIHHSKMVIVDAEWIKSWFSQSGFPIDVFELRAGRLF